MTLRMPFIIRLSAVILLGLVMASCKGSGTSVTQLYKFPATKDVRVRVVVDYKLTTDSGAAVQMDQQNFYLNAYLFYEGETQVAIGYEGGAAPVEDLPVTMTSTNLAFDAIVRVPVAADPGENGFSLYFKLKEANSAFWLQDQTTVKNLEALKGSIQPGTDAANNVIPLSLASTLAYRLTRDLEVDDGTLTHVDAYEKILGKLTETMKVIEGKIDSSKTPDLATFVSALTAALKVEIATDKTLQSEIVSFLQPAAKAKFGEESANSTLAETFTSTLKTFVSEAKPVLTTNGRSEPDLFKTGSIDTASIPDAESYVSVIFAPAALAFTDADGSSAIGGTITITPPDVTDGIEGYNIYFGGETIASGKVQLAGTVAASASPLQLALPNGTSIPADGQRFWVFPIVRGKELQLATSVAIVNTVNSATSSPAPTLTATASTSTEANLAWTNVSGSSLVLVYVEGSAAPSSCATGSSIANSSPYQVSNLTPNTTYRFALCSGTTGSPLVVAAAVTTPANVQTQPEVTIGSNVSGVSSDRFGSAVAVFGSKALIGTPMNDGDQNGLVLAFELTSGTWTYKETLSNPESASNTLFGTALAMYGNRAVVGASSAAAAYYYEYNTAGQAWIYKHKFAGDYDFGDAVVMDGTTVAVGKPARSGTPYVKVFEGGGTSWTEVAQLDGPANAEYGEALALTPTHLFVGGTMESGTGRSNGTLFAYTRASNYVDSFEITSSSAFHGHALAASGNTLAVGVPFDGSSWTGEVRLYTLSGTNTWTLGQTLTGSGGSKLGMSVALQGDVLVAGAPGELSGEGKVYIYRRTGGVFAETDSVRVPSAASDNGSGGSVALHGNTLLIGSYEMEYTGFGSSGVQKVGFIDMLQVD